MRPLLALCLLAVLAAAEPPPDRERVEAARRAGLAWLVAHQLADGADAGAWPGTHPRQRIAVAALAGLALLADGRLPGEGRDGAAVTRALTYVLSRQDGGGYFGADDASGMYIHAIATVFALSCLGMQADAAAEAALAERCRRAVQVIVLAQQVTKPALARGGWRYTPITSESDVSVSSWQLVALHAARQCGLALDPAVIEEGLEFVERAWAEVPASEGVEAAAGFTYRPGVSKHPEPGPTGAALFVRALLRGGSDDERARRGLAFLDRFPTAWGGAHYHGYFWFVSFYLAQGRFQAGGEAWRDAAARLQTLLLRHQEGDGRWGLPPDHAPQIEGAGPAYPTAMAVLLLSLDSQFLPIFQRQSRLF
jgi:hypothetical protein